ncbi:hypothetical protein C7974DRAFT_103107 [Boeremia exigua]|uniref:uncharacterized protein n=1 Tax=Boeremia exigua TaxID=749465 RepID=UPI001E8D1055|nr:uncharacterized protein C7974DRAFT_103107 [Boeremia exigua]KAH6642482.1 hypothetical protein C7974DRAFT_103107 [Boeremia exigua]
MPKRKRRTHPGGAAPLTDLKWELKQELDRSGYGNTKRDAKFISMGFITRLFSLSKPSKLKKSLEKDWEAVRNMGDENRFPNFTLEQLEEDVRSRTPKLYTILQLIDQPQLIIPLLYGETPVTDSIWEGHRTHREDLPYCTKDYLRSVKYLSEYAEEIYEKQWYVPPVLRSNACEIFPVGHFRFPFAEDPVTIGEGGYGEVYKVKIAPGHLKLEEDHSYEEGSFVAWKEARLDRTTRAAARKEVETIKSRTHWNIVKFHTSFFAGRERPWARDEPVECLHMFFQYGNSTMEGWFERKSAPPTLENELERQKFVMKSIGDITEAVMVIHRTDEHGEVAFHHDLKPGNILFFDSHPGTWKICDFGMARLKYYTESSTAQGPNNRFGTPDYQPPEYIENGTESHGRPFDVWSLGCIILELATVWKFGWADEGIHEFRERRRQAASSLANADRSSSSQSDHAPFKGNQQVIKDWMDQIESGSNVDADFRKVLHLVSEMLVSKAQRIFVWEVHMDLYQQANPGLTRQELRDYFRRNVVQRPKENRNGSSDTHNPQTRARELGKDWQLDILEEHGWSDGRPQATQQLAVKRVNTGTYLSTLEKCSSAEIFEKSPFYGRLETDAQIDAGFGTSNCIGLWGLGGIGKSHLAYHYAARLRNPRFESDRKHTFWVDAATKARFEDSIRNIARAIGLVASSQEDIYKNVQTWLCNAESGPWMVVIDDLNNNNFAQDLVQFIPKFSGQILITTRDRAVLTDLDSLFPQGMVGMMRCCFHIEQLPTSDLRTMFNMLSGNWPVHDSNTIDELLDALPSPACVRFLVKYFSEFNMSAHELPSVLDAPRRNLALPEKVFTNLTRNNSFFAPLSDRGMSGGPTSKESRRWSSGALKLLGEVSFLDKDNINLALLRQKYAKEFVLRELVGRLKNCSFLVAGTAPETFRVHKTIQSLMRQWTFTHFGLRALLKLQDNALCMILHEYNDNKLQSAETFGVGTSSYFQKLPLLQHFEYFLDFSKEYFNQIGLQAPELSCSYNMARSVITFSQVYLEDGRYEDAACVLECLKTVYKGSEWRPQLIRYLCKAYTSPPLASRDPKLHSDGAEALERLYRLSITQQTRNHEQEWWCLLDLANWHSKCGQPEQARAVIERLREVNMTARLGKPIVSRNCTQGLCDWAVPWMCPHDRHFPTQTIEIKLAIAKSIAKARYHVAIAKRTEVPKEKTQALCTARDLLFTARTVTEQQLPNEYEWLSKQDEDLADVLCRMDDTISIKRGIHIYTELTSSPLSGRSGVSELRMWGLKCSLAFARLKLHAENTDEVNAQAFNVLHCALEDSKARYGRPEGLVFDGHVRVCAHILREACEMIGNKEEAKRIAVEYRLEVIPRASTLPVIDERNKLGPIVLLLVFFALYFLLARLFECVHAAL